MSGLVIVGGSYAGLNIALAARQHGYSERIRILSNEPVLPYHRPPLSKGYLLGATDPQTLPLRGEAFYAQNGIDVLLQTQVHSIGPARLQTNFGNVPFEKLAIATGARARLVDLPGIELDGVVTLRSLADTEAIRQRLADVSRAVIIGAGFIGLELAATLRKLQKEVTVLEGQQRVLARATTPSVSAFISGEHQRHGIDLRCNTSVVEITGDRQRVKSVRLADGTLCPADLVVLAVGALPNGELGAPLGLRTAERRGRQVADIFMLSPKEVAAAMQVSSSSDKPLAELPESMLERIARNAEAVCLFGWSPYLYNPKLHLRLHRIKVPTVLLWGEQDRLAPLDYARSFVAGLGQARLETLDACGHLIYVDCPEAAAARIVNFA